MSSSTAPVFILVPGVFGLPTLYERLVKVLSDAGYESESIHNPSVGKQFIETYGRPANVYDDADHVNEIAAGYCDKGQDVVLVGNSYGGFIITEAAKGLCRAERDAAGKSGGALIGLVFLSCLVSSLGSTVMDLVEGKQPPPETAPVDGMLDPMPADVFGPVWCSELPDKAEQLRYGSMTDIQSVAVFDSKITYEGHRHVPSVFVVAGRDAWLECKWQHESIDELMKEGLKDVRKVVLESDHLMMVSHAQQIGEVLIELAGV